MDLTLHTAVYESFQFESDKQVPEWGRCFLPQAKTKQAASSDAQMNQNPAAAAVSLSLIAMCFLSLMSQGEEILI